MQEVEGDRVVGDLLRRLAVRSQLARPALVGMAGRLQLLEAALDRRGLAILVRRMSGAAPHGLEEAQGLGVLRILDPGEGIALRRHPAQVGLPLAEPGARALAGSLG